MYRRLTAKNFLLTLTVTALAGLTACADYAKRSTGTTLDDQALEYLVSNEIYQDPGFSQKDHVKVEVNNGVVLLAGETVSQANKEKATKIAEQQKMTKRVVNDLQVGERGWLGDKSNNSWLTSKVNSVLLAENPLPGNDASRIKVVSSRGTVYLMGMVSHKEGNEVAEIVRNIRGVTKVVKIFDYTDKD
jgi:osmotically-inducible protein OsmY